MPNLTAAIFAAREKRLLRSSFYVLFVIWLGIFIVCLLMKTSLLPISLLILLVFSGLLVLGNLLVLIIIQLYPNLHQEQMQKELD